MIRNKNKIISYTEIVCNNLFSQGLGLMFRLKKQNLIMNFKNKRIIQLHNLFVFYPLEILILDNNKRVVEINKNFKPFTFWNSTKKGKYLIEIGKEESKNKIKIGDKVEF